MLRPLHGSLCLLRKVQRLLRQEKVQSQVQGQVQRTWRLQRALRRRRWLRLQLSKVQHLAVASHGGLLMQLPLKSLTSAELLATLSAAELSLGGFSRATAEQGSLIQSWVGGAPVEAFDHYPPPDVIDRQHGYQFFYHCHRSNGLEHGHVHLFAHATKSGRKRYKGKDDVWARSAPTHLIAIGLDAKGLPISIFTVNRWVTDGHWLSSASILKWLGNLNMQSANGHTASCEWLAGFVKMYLPVISRLLSQRDKWLERQPDTQLALADKRREVISTVKLDWAADLQRLEMEVNARGLSQEA